MSYKVEINNDYLVIIDSLIKKDGNCFFESIEEFVDYSIKSFLFSELRVSKVHHQDKTQNSGEVVSPQH